MLAELAKAGEVCERDVGELPAVRMRCGRVPEAPDVLCDPDADVQHLEVHAVDLTLGVGADVRHHVEFHGHSKCDDAGVRRHLRVLEDEVGVHFRDANGVRAHFQDIVLDVLRHLLRSTQIHLDGVDICVAQGPEDLVLEPAVAPRLNRVLALELLGPFSVRGRALAAMSNGVGGFRYVW